MFAFHYSDSDSFIFYNFLVMYFPFQGLLVYAVGAMARTEREWLGEVNPALINLNFLAMAQ